MILHANHALKRYTCYKLQQSTYMYEVLSLTSTEHLKPLLCYEIRKPIQYSKLLFDKYMFLGGELGPIMILGPLQIKKNLTSR